MYSGADHHAAYRILYNFGCRHDYLGMICSEGTTTCRYWTPDALVGVHSDEQIKCVVRLYSAISPLKIIDYSDPESRCDEHSDNRQILSIHLNWNIKVSDSNSGCLKDLLLPYPEQHMYIDE